MIDDAVDERELLEGLRVIAKVTGLCTELAVEADAERPRFFDMCSDTRMIGGPNPDGRYLLAMIRGDRTYRVTGTRGSTAYLGFQVLAGTGLTPRRMAGYLSDTDLKLSSGAFALVFSAGEPAAHILGAAQWVPIPADASSIVVREYIGDADTEDPATMDIECVDAEPLQPITDAEAAEQFTAMAWTIVKLTTLHRTIKPELLTQPNALLTAEAAELGSADTTPDNLYMIGTFALEPRRVAGAGVQPARHAVLEHHAGEHLARMPRAAAPAQLRHQQGVTPGRRRHCPNRYRRQGLRARPLAGHRRSAPRLRRAALARQPRGARRAHHGPPRRGDSVSAERFQPDHARRAGVRVGRQR